MDTHHGLLSAVGLVNSTIIGWCRTLLIKISQNKLKFTIYVALALAASLLASHLLADDFSLSKNGIKYWREPKRRPTRSASGQLSSSSSSPSNGIDPYANRPRIQSQNGHLVIQASQDKNIDFKTSGSRGSVTINGLKLDQLIGVARAFDRTRNVYSLQDNATKTSATTATENNSDSIQDQYELLVKSLLSSVQKLATLERANDLLTKELASLNKKVSKLGKRVSQRTSKLNELAKEQDNLVVKLKENNCFDTKNGGGGQPVCKNGAICIDLYDSFKCLCPAGMEGLTCEQDVDECARFRGTDLGCQNGGKCINTPGGFRCECPAQYHGVHCTERHDDCSMASSAAMCGHGKCINLARTQTNQPNYECLCDQGWTQDPSSRACIVDINECLAGQNVTTSSSSSGGGDYLTAASAPPLQGAYPCSQNPYVECINLPGSFQCGPCPPGYQGNGRLCRDVDECQHNNGGCSLAPLVECINLAGSARCGPCPPGYQGDGAQCSRVSACQAEPNGGCHPLAKCVELAGVANRDQSRLCICQYPFIGAGVGQLGCALPSASPANSGPTDGGTPPAAAGDPNSLAAAALASSNAAGQSVSALTEMLAQLPNLTQQYYTTLVNQDDCQPNPCLNGGQCLYSDGNFECLCPISWSGRLCDELANFTCGGRFTTSRGLFEFPVGGTYDKLIRVASSRQLTAGGGASGAPPAGQSEAKPEGARQTQYQCTWSISVASNMSLKLNFTKLMHRPGTTKQVQVFQFNSTKSITGSGRPQVSPPSCHEYLDVRERFDHALELAGAQGRLLARLCVHSGASMSRAASTASGADKSRREAVLIGAESNMVDLEYSYAGGQQQQQKPELSFQLEWSKMEPACGGELPVVESGSVSSPRFPDFYPAGTECRYLLRVPPGRRIRIQFGELTLLTGRPQSGQCADSLIILDGALGGSDRPVLFRHCANELAGRLSLESSYSGPIISSSSAVEVVLVSRPESSLPLMRPKQKRGFYLTYASELSVPGCGGLYTAKSAVIKSLDYIRSGAAAGTGDDSALAFEFARYFNFKDSPITSAKGDSYSRSRDAWLSAAGVSSSFSAHPPNTSSSSGSSSSSSSSGSSSRAGSQSMFTPKYKTRCEYEIRPADQARNHRIELDWLEMASELSDDTMGALSGFSRRTRCMRSRLMIFDGNPVGSSSGASAAGAAGGQDSESGDGATNNLQSSPLLLATFCAGDRYNSSLPQLTPIVSTGHLLYLIYESSQALDEAQDVQPYGGSESPQTSATGSAKSMGSRTRQSQSQQRPARQQQLSGFKLRYSTVCTAVYRQLEGQIQTELDADVDECLYHIMLPPNNTISLLIEPMLAGGGGGGGSSSDGATNQQQAASIASLLTLPDGSCAAQAVFMDGAVARGKLAFAQMERQLRSFDFSSSASGSSFVQDDSLSSASSGAAAGKSFQQTRTNAADSLDSSLGADQQQGGSSSGSFAQAAAGLAAATDPGSNYSYWQYSSSQVHDIKEFDVCKLPAFGIDSVWSHMSLMFKLNPKVKQLQAAGEAGAGSGAPLGKLKIVITYHAESACGGVIEAPPRSGSIKLVSSKAFALAGAISRTTMGSHFEQLLKGLFDHQCAWILRNAPNQRIQFRFTQVPVDEINQRRREWLAWLRNSSAGGAKGSQKNGSSSRTQTTRAPEADKDNWAYDVIGWSEPSEPSSVPVPIEQQLSRLITNCSQAFQEIIEVYEPSANRTRFLCPSDLVHYPGNQPYWTSLSDTLYIRLINDTLARPESLKGGASISGNKTSASSKADRVFFPGRKPLKGFPPTLEYKMLADHDNTCGGRLIQSSGTIRSPRFPFNYPPHSYCIWIIEAPSAEHQIRLNFSKFQLEEQASCWFDYVEIRSGPTGQSPLIGHFCNNDLQSRLLISPSSSVFLKFRSDGHLNRGGFEVHFDAAQTGCGGLLTASSGQVDSPNYPFAYAHGANCEWTIEVSQANRISLHFDDLDLSGTRVSQRLDDPDDDSSVSPASSSTSANGKGKRTGTGAAANCKTDGLAADYLEIFDSSNGLRSKSLGRYCHLNQLDASRDLHSTGNKLHIVYKSQAQDSGRGFRLSYSANCTFVQELSGFGGVIESPGYPADLEDHSSCTWVLRAPLGSNISIALTDLNLVDARVHMYEFGRGLSSLMSSVYGDEMSPLFSSPSPKPRAKAKSSPAPTTAGRASATSAGPVCSMSYDMLNIWSGQLVTASNATIEQRLAPLNASSIAQFNRKQKQSAFFAAPAPGPNNVTSVGAYNFTLAHRSLCGQFEQLSDQDRFIELPSNVAIINLVANSREFSGEPRRFRLEWQARGCGGQQQILPASGDASSQSIVAIRFDERLNLTSWQTNKPLECIWSVDASRAGGVLELGYSSDMRSPTLSAAAGTRLQAATAAFNDASSGGNQVASSAACKDASLTLYDGLSTTSDVLVQNCDQKQEQDTLWATSGQLLIRYFSSGRHAGAVGRNFRISGWTSDHEAPDCLRSVYDVSTPFLRVAGTRTSPKYPDLYDAQPYECLCFIKSELSGRLRITVQELDIPLTDDSASTTGGGDDGGGGGLLDSDVCFKSGNYLLVKSSAEEDTKEVYCGKLDLATGVGVSSPESLKRATFIVEQRAVWIKFASNGRARGRWKLNYDRLCGTSITQLTHAEEFDTPNYPNRPDWPQPTGTGSGSERAASGGSQLAENVCIWRLNTQQGDRAMMMDMGKQDKAGAASTRIHFGLVNFIESDKPAGQDCLRVYEGASISLRQSSYNLTELDARLEPKVKICRKSDLTHSSLHYVSLGSELTILITGNVIAKFRVKPYVNYCGGDFTMAQAEFASPNYPQPYGSDLDCHYFVMGSPGSRLSLNFATFDLPEPQLSDTGPLLGDDDGDDTSGSSGPPSKTCDNTDHVEIRRMSTVQRLKMHPSLAADLKDSLNKQFESLSQQQQRRVKQTGSGNNTGSVIVTLAPRSRAGNGTTAQAVVLPPPARLLARKLALDRLVELARVYYTLGQDSYWPASLRRYAMTSLGLNGRHFAKLEDFYSHSSLVGRYCGRSAPKLSPDLLRDDILIRFRSHSSAQGAGTKRGFLASYKLEYGGRIKVDPPAPEASRSSSSSSSSLGFISSPSFPDPTRLGSALTWHFETQLGYVLEFELVSLTLGPIHESCQDSLAIYDGLKPPASVQLAKLCGHLSFKRMLDESMSPLWLSALSGSISPRKLAVNLAHEPLVQASLLRRFRTSSNVASVVYDNLRFEGAFLLCYKSIAKPSASETAAASANGTLLDPLERPLGADEALEEQLVGDTSQSDVSDSSFDSSAASKSCSGVFRLAMSKTLKLGDASLLRGYKTYNRGSASNWTSAGDQVQLTSPDWPNEVQASQVECHWLITTNDNTNIQLSIDPSASMMLSAAQGGAAAAGGGDNDNEYATFKASLATRYMREQCFKARERNFVVIYDGASKLAPVLGRYCLPVPPVRLQSSGRHLFVRYVHAKQPDLGASGPEAKSPAQLDDPTLSDDNDRLIEQQQRAVRTSLFRAVAQVSQCGGQYHVMYQAHIRDRPEVSGSAKTATTTPSTYEHNLDCLYYVFATDLDQVLTIHDTMSELALAKEPTNAQCTVGDFIEIYDLQLSPAGGDDDNQEEANFMPGSALDGRLLGRYCAGHAMEAPIESPGSAVVIRFHTDGQNAAKGFSLFVLSGEPRYSCPKAATLTLNQEQPFGRLMSPNLPHGFRGKRRCTYTLVAPRNQTLEVTFVRLIRPMEAPNPATPNIAPKCLDSLTYLDDNEATTLRYSLKPLKELRSSISGIQLRQLVQEAPCAGPSPRYSKMPDVLLRNISAPLASKQAAGGSEQQMTAANGPARMSTLSPEDFYALLLLNESKSVYRIRTNSHTLMLEYAANNLQPGQGFLAAVRVVNQQQPDRNCGGDVYPRAGQNLLQSAKFGQPMNDSEPHLHCDWSLKLETRLRPETSRFQQVWFSSSGSATRERYTNPASSYLTSGDLTSGGAAGGQWPGYATEVPATFLTSYLVFQVLEIPPLIQNTTLFEDQFGTTNSAKASDLCGLNRLLISDSGSFDHLTACGYLTALPLHKWLFVGEFHNSNIMLRTKNLQQVVYRSNWPPATGDDGANLKTDGTGSDGGQLEGRTKLFRGVRAWLYETACQPAEWLPGGDVLRIVSHSSYRFRSEAATNGSAAADSRPVVSSYQPGICLWALVLVPGHYEISFISINLRPPGASKSQAAPVKAKPAATGKEKTTSCDIYAYDGDVDHLVVKNSGADDDSPVLARYCAQNQLEARTHKIELSSSTQLTIEFVAGLGRLQEGHDKYADSTLTAGATSGKSTPAELYGFDMLVTRTKNSTVNDYCRRDSRFNIYRSITKQRDTSNAWSFIAYDSSQLSPSTLYPKNVHCQVDMALDDDLRFNFTFTKFFDLEPSRDCKNDYVELIDMIEVDGLEAGSDSGNRNSNKITTTTMTKQPTRGGKQKQLSTTSKRPAQTTPPPTALGPGKVASSAVNETGRRQGLDSPYRGYTRKPKVIGRWCGRTLPKGSFISTSSKIRIVFHSNEHIEGKGFKLEWSTVAANLTAPLDARTSV